VEAVAPVEDPALRRELWDILQICLADQRSAWDMQADGTYLQRRPGAAASRIARDGSHKALMARTRRRA
jgi:polyphosphate kinase